MTVITLEMQMRAWAGRMCQTKDGRHKGRLVAISRNFVQWPGRMVILEMPQSNHLGCYAVDKFNWEFLIPDARHGHVVPWEDVVPVALAVSKDVVQNHELSKFRRNATAIHADSGLQLERVPFKPISGEPVMAYQKQQSAVAKAVAKREADRKATWYWDPEYVGDGEVW